MLSSPLSHPPVASVDPRVLLVESDEQRGYLLVDNLAQAPEAYVVMQVSTARQAVSQIEGSDCDVIVFDALSVGASAGAAMVSLLSARAPDVPLVVITNHEDDAWTTAALRAGASQVCAGPVHQVRLDREIRVAMERHTLAGRAALAATRDPLTHAVNRATFEEELIRTVRRAERTDGRFVLLYVDLDGFKAVNDRLGHDAGDMVLKVVGKRLQTAAEGHGLVARLGGDEFALLIDDVESLWQPLLLAEQLVAEIEAPIRWRDGEVTVSCRVGAALYPASGTTATTLLAAADQAMYAAKRSESHVHVFLPGGMAAYHVTNQPMDTP